MKRYLSLMTFRTKVKCAGVVLIALIGSLFASEWPVRLGELYNSISNGTIDSLAQGGSAVAMFGLIYFLSEGSSILRRVALEGLVSINEANIRGESLEKLLKLPVSYYSDSLKGEKTAQLNQGVTGLSQLIKVVCNDMFATVSTVAFALVQVFLNAPPVMLGLMLIYFTSTILVSAWQIRSQNGVRETIVAKKNKMDGQICQSISNLEYIRSRGAEVFEKKRLLPGIQAVSQLERYHHMYMGGFDCLKQAVKVLFQVLILLLCLKLVSIGQMAPGSVITVCLLFQQLIRPIDEVYRFLDETAASVIKAKMLLKIVDTPVDEMFHIPTTKVTLHGSDIHLKDVVVTNPEKTIPLAWYQDIVLPGGKIIALQGPNGCGKSSLVRCLTRFYPHTQGRISLFGNELSTYGQKQLTDLIYYVPQTAFFIAGTIRENLLFGIEREVSDAELVAALEKVHLVGAGHGDTVIQTDSMEALNFRISEDGGELSGGMKQRLSLARAFLYRPAVYFFDEVTANLDKSATNFVLTNIEACARKIGAGIVYITHDPAVIGRCDEVVTLRNKLGENLPVEAA